MKRRMTSRFFGLLLAAALVLGGSQAALGAAVQDDKSIENKVDITYEIGTTGVGIEQLNAASVSFIVDELVKPELSSAGATVNVNPGGDGAIPFTLTNAGNYAREFALELAELTDDFNMTTFAIYQEDDTAPGYDEDDDLVTLPSDGGSTTMISIPAGESRVFYLVGIGAPASGTNGHDDIYHVIATAVNDDNATAMATSDDSGGSDTANRDYIYLDGVAGPATGTGTWDQDGVKDARHSIALTFNYETVNLSVSKGVALQTGSTIDGTLYSFPVTGATMRYTVTITNNDSSDATNVTLSDAIPDDTTFVEGSVGGGQGGTAKFTDDDMTGTPTWEEWATYTGNGGTAATVTGIQVSGFTVASGGNSKTIIFDVTID